MHRFYSVAALAVTFILAACVTINVYFPEAEAGRAADRFIRDGLGDEELAPAPSGSGMAANGSWWLALSPVGMAHSQSPDIGTHTPQIRAIKGRTTARQRPPRPGRFEHR